MLSAKGFTVAQKLGFGDPVEMIPWIINSEKLNFNRKLFN